MRTQRTLAKIVWVLTLLAGQAGSQSKGLDISGMWLVQDPGSGSFTDWFNNVPKPKLRPDVIKDNEAQAASEAAGNVVNTAPRLETCPVGNFPLMMASSPALNIVQSRDEVLIGAEAGRARFIYMDGRDHSETKAQGYRASGFGHSIGHIEGETLVVDTVAFPTICDNRHPVMVTPGGGRARSTTHLAERFRLADNGEEMSITFTWEDPTVFLEPHTYTYRFKKLPEAHPFENN